MENSLIGNFYSHVQKVSEYEDTFANDLQVMAHEIFLRKPEFIRHGNPAPYL